MPPTTLTAVTVITGFGTGTDGSATITTMAFIEPEASCGCFYEVTLDLSAI